MAAKSLTDYISQVSKDLFYFRNISTIDNILGVEILSSIKMEQYLNILQKNAELITLDPLDVIKYSYKPQLLSQVIYGTENLYYMILLLNNATVENFIPKNIYLLSASNRALIESIINKENSK